MRNHVKAYLILGAWFIVLLVFLLLVGCVTKPSLSTAVQTATPAQVLTTIVYKTNWLVVVGFLTCFAAVYAFFSGNSKAVPLFAAGAFLIGGVSIYAAINAVLLSWLPWFEIVVPIIGAIAFGLWAYGHYHRTKQVETLESVKSYLDKDKDGKVTPADIKAVLGI